MRGLREETREETEANEASVAKENGIPPGGGPASWLRHRGHLQLENSSQKGKGREMGGEMGRGWWDFKFPEFQFGLLSGLCNTCG